MANISRFQEKRIGLNPSLIRFLLGLILAFSLSACAPLTVENDLTGWTYSNLAWLGDGETEEPESHIIAAYYRQIGLEHQVRFDLLEMSGGFQPEITFALDTTPGGSATLPDGTTTQLAWDVLFSFTPNQPPSAIDSIGYRSQAIIPRLIVDPSLDTVVIAWNRNLTPAAAANLNFQIFIHSTKHPGLTSQTPLIKPGAVHPDRAPLLLAFWNTLPSATPAQALRRWDGAHTGPLGQRHGLNVLLGLSKQYNIPLTLLDLRQPQSLQALEYMQVAGPLKDRALAGKVTIPMVASSTSTLTGQSLQVAAQSSSRLGWPHSQIAFGPFSPPFPVGYTHLFADLPNRNHILDFEGHRLIPLPDSIYSTNSQPDSSLTSNGLSLPVKKALLKAALTTDPTDLVVLGGNLTQSLWAEHSVAPAVFAYIAAHPWIAPLAAQDLLQFPAQKASAWPLPGCADLLCSPPMPDDPQVTRQGNPIPSGFTSQQLANKLRTELLLLPSNDYAQSAINLFLSLTAPSPSPDLVRLRSNYLGQVGYLIFAAHWAEQPSPHATCALDIDWDGLPECILANHQTLLIIELDGAGLVLAGIPQTQWMAPSAQLSVGTGDPSTWNLAHGQAADPAVIPGAFASTTRPPAPAQVEEIKPGKLILTRPGTTERITFAINGNSVRVELVGSLPYATKIPLLMDTASIPPSNWSEMRQLTCSQVACELPYATGVLAITAANAEITADNFLDSAPFITSAEIPDRAYPTGHFLPFHLAVLNLQASENGMPLSISFEFRQ